MSAATFQSRHYLTGCAFITAATRFFWSGNEPALFKYPTGTQARLLAEDLPNSGLVRLYTALNIERILVTDTAGIGEVLVRRAYDFQNPKFIKFFWSLGTGGGIEALEGNIHKAKRKQLQPAFAHRHIKNLYPRFWEKALVMVEQIAKETHLIPGSSGIINAREWTRRATIDILGSAGFGYEFDALQNPEGELNVAYRKLSREYDFAAKVVFVLSHFIEPSIFAKLPIKTIKDMQRARERVRDKVREVVRRKTEEFNNDKLTDIDMISVALSSGIRDEHDLVTNMMTFLTAGHETTSSTLSWAFYTLCKYPHIQTRLRAEVRSALSEASTKSTPGLSADILEALPYLNAVCNEVLRFYPVVSGQHRQAVVDTTVNGTHIPAGTLMLISSHVTNRDKSLWGADADCFDPERWMVEGQSKTGGVKNAYANGTFGHGPKVCIGAGFAFAEMHCIIAAMVDKFEIELVEPTRVYELAVGIVNGPRGGVDLRIKLAA